MVFAELLVLLLLFFSGDKFGVIQTPVFPEMDIALIAISGKKGLARSSDTGIGK